MKVICRRQPNWLNFDLDFPCEIHLQQPELPFNPNDGVYRVYCDSFEPTSSCVPHKHMEQVFPMYSLVLTKNEDTVSRFPNARLFLFGSSFIYPALPSKKEFSVSFITTRPPWHLSGYDIRYELWRRQDEIKVPKVFYSSNRMPIDPNRLLPGDGSNMDKMVMFESMFHIAVENTNEPNYFTEKINDCFWTETVPLYWGNTKTIDNLFDSSGVIHFQTVDELIDRCNNLTEADYFSRVDAMKRNKIVSAEYARDMNDRIREQILLSRG